MQTFRYAMLVLRTRALPPNSPIPDCAAGSCCADGGQAVITARSLHPGGVHVALGDGSVRFIHANVDWPVWQALGTRQGGELAP